MTKQKYVPRLVLSFGTYFCFAILFDALFYVLGEMVTSLCLEVLALCL